MTLHLFLDRNALTTATSPLRSRMDNVDYNCKLFELAFRYLVRVTTVLTMDLFRFFVDANWFPPLRCPNSGFFSVLERVYLGASARQSTTRESPGFAHEFDLLLITLL